MPHLVADLQADQIHATGDGTTRLISPIPSLSVAAQIHLGVYENAGQLPLNVEDLKSDPSACRHIERDGGACEGRVRLSQRQGHGQGCSRIVWFRDNRVSHATFRDRQLNVSTWGICRRTVGVVETMVNRSASASKAVRPL